MSHFLSKILPEIFTEQRKRQVSILIHPSHTPTSLEFRNVMCELLMMNDNKALISFLVLPYVVFIFDNKISLIFKCLERESHYLSTANWIPVIYFDIFIISASDCHQYIQNQGSAENIYFFYSDADIVKISKYITGIQLAVLK